MKFSRSLVYAHLINQLEDVLATLKSELNVLRIEQSENGKSSMGDKYETSAELTRSTISQLEQRVARVQQHLHYARQFAGQPTQKEVVSGSIIVTSSGTFLLGVPFGKLPLNNDVVIGISSASPIGKQLLSKQVGSQVLWNNNASSIKAIH